LVTRLTNAASSSPTSGVCRVVGLLVETNTARGVENAGLRISTIFIPDAAFHCTRPDADASGMAGQVSDDLG
jgi:hypothetical protein